MHKTRFMFSMLPLLAALASNPLYSDVYRWVDDEGNEQFGNKPPPGSETSLVSSYTPDGKSEEELILEQADQAFARADLI